MSDLKTLILNDFEKDHTLIDKLVNLSGLKNPSRLLKFLNRPESELDCFESLVRMVRFLYPDREFELMNAYIRTVNPDKVIARHGIEYANCNRLDDLHEYLIDQLRKSRNKESQEWGTIHYMYQLIDTGEISTRELLDYIVKQKYKCVEVKIYNSIVQLYCYYRLNDYDQIKNHVPQIQKQVDKLKHPFIRESFSIRLAAAMTGASVHLGNLEDIRKYGENVLNQKAQRPLKSSIHLHVANSYLFSNYQISLFHLNKAEEFSVQGRLVTEIKRSRNFLANYWGETPPFLDYISDAVSDIHEIAFYNFRQGRIMDGLIKLKSTKWDSLTVVQKAFHLFYKGIALNDRDCFFESIRYFNEAGDKFYVNLPLIELEKLGESNDILNALRN